MPVQFNSIPISIRTPGDYIEVDNTKAQPGFVRNKKILVIAQRLSTGTVAAATLTQVFSPTHAALYFGEGSFMHNTFRALFANDNTVEKYAIALDDNSGGSAALGAVDFTGSVPTAAGTVFLYIAGQQVLVPVVKTDTASTIATAAVAAINALKHLPVTAAVDGSIAGKVNITCRHKGTLGNGIDIRLNYFGSQGGEALPTGVAAAITAMASGATDPTASTAINAIPDQIFDFIVFPFIDSTSLGVLETELNDRWAGTTMLDGHAFIAKQDTVSNLATFGNGRNNQHVTCIGFNNSPSPTYEWAAALCGQVAASANIQSARPFTGLPLVGIKAPPVASVFIQSERNTLLFDGIATYTYDDGSGLARIERVITMYKTNAQSQLDASYLDANTLFQLSDITLSVANRIGTKYSRYCLADNGTPIAAGMNIVTPNDIRAEIIAHFLELQEQGLVENLDQFIKDIVVERDANDRTRVNALLPYDLINQLLIFAGQVQFRL
jgi:phage tail sheath gpL-like